MTRADLAAWNGFAAALAAASATLAGLVFVAASANAWVLLVEVIRDERYRPLTEPTGLAADDPGDQAG